MDAAVHRGAHQRPDVFVLDRALVFGKARGIDAERHRLILQIAFAALIANRTIERVIDEQEFHHAFAGFLHHGRFGENDRRLAVRAGAQIPNRDGAGSRRLRRATFDLDKAHPAIAGDRQPLVKAKARNLRPCLLAGLEQRIFRRDVDFDIVHDEFRHFITSMWRFDGIETPHIFKAQIFRRLGHKLPTPPRRRSL